MCQPSHYWRNDFYGFARSSTSYRCLACGRMLRRQVKWEMPTNRNQHNMLNQLKASTRHNTLTKYQTTHPIDMNNPRSDLTALLWASMNKPIHNQIILRIQVYDISFYFLSLSFSRLFSSLLSWIPFKHQIGRHHRSGEIGICASWIVHFSVAHEIWTIEYIWSWILENHSMTVEILNGIIFFHSSPDPCHCHRERGGRNFLMDTLIWDLMLCFFPLLWFDHLPFSYILFV